METQEWWRAKWYETPTVEFVEWVISESVRRRDAELLKKVEGMKLTMAERIAAKKTGLGIRNQTLDDVIKLIKGE